MSGNGAVGFPASLAARSAVSATYVFTVPDPTHAAVTVELLCSPTTPVVVFKGTVK